MQTHQLQDRQDLNDLMNGWMHRDLGEWEQLRNLFPSGRHNRNYVVRRARERFFCRGFHAYGRFRFAAQNI